jgi:hypothetical protein
VPLLALRHVPRFNTGMAPIDPQGHQQMREMAPRESTIDQEINSVSMFRPHVVVLGAGASRAVCPGGDAKGNLLPLMADFVDVLNLNSLIKRWGLNPSENFEEIFSVLHEQQRVEQIKELEAAIENYFGQLTIPTTPTIYDQLLLSLRKKDIIATFNWDPLLLQAYRRNVKKMELPTVLFLHGNVASGYCPRDGSVGNAGGYCRHCGELFERTPLLYPIKKKNYAANQFIAAEWATLKRGFKNAFMITIFGYSGPKSDEEAISAMSEAWGSADQRSLEQTSFITLQDDDEVRDNWSKFIHSHHYEVHDTFYQSWIANHPRRTGEAYWNQYFERMYLPNNPIPKDVDFPELWAWFARFTEAERSAEALRPR